MEYRLLGRSGLKVSTITMGTMTFGNRQKIGDTDQKGAQRQIDLCLDAGVNLIDTANAYTRGVSEEIIGEAMDKKRWKKALIATKVRFPMGDGPNDNGLSRWHIIQQCEGSLKRLKTDVIDLYQVHQWDGSTPLEETMEALDTLVKQGKVRYVGCSNYSGWHIMKALGVAEKHNYQRFVSQQIHYTLHCPRGRVRTRADQPRPGSRHPRLVADRGRAAQRQIPPRQAGAGGHAPHRRSRRAPGLRLGEALRHHRGDHGCRRGSTVSRAPRWRWPGCCSGRA